MKLDTRIWAVISFVLVGAILAGGWFLGAAPFLEAKATAEEQRAAIEAQNAQHEATLIALQEASERLPELQARAIELEKAIPSDLESSPLINAINNLAASSGVTIKSITIEEALAYQAPAGGEPAAADADAETAATATDDAADDGAPAPLTDGRITSENFALVPISIEVVGPLPNVLAFIHGVQTGQRLVLVTKLDTKTDENAGAYTSVITGATYVLTRNENLQIGAALAAAAAEEAAGGGTEDEVEDEEPADSAAPDTEATPTPTPTP